VVLRQRPSPVARAAGSSSPELRLSFRVLRSVPARRPQAWAPFLGVLVPSRDINRRSPPGAGIPSPLRSVPGVSHALDGFLLRRPRGSVSPRCHVWGFALQGFSLRRSRATSSVTVALMPFGPNLLPPQCSGARSRAPSPGPCSASESVALREELARAPLDPLLDFSSSGYSLRSPCLVPSHRLRSWPRRRGHAHASTTMTFSVSPASGPTLVAWIRCALSLAAIQRSLARALRARRAPTRSRFSA